MEQKREKRRTNSAVSADVRHVQPAKQVPRLRTKAQEPGGGDKNGGLSTSTDRQRRHTGRGSRRFQIRNRRESRLLVCLQIRCSSCISLRGPSPERRRPPAAALMPIQSQTWPGRLDRDPTQDGPNSAFAHHIITSKPKPFGAASATAKHRELLGWMDDGSFLPNQQTTRP